MPVVDSPHGWGLVSCNWWCLSDLSTLKQNHWMLFFFLAFQNNSSLPVWSPFPVCNWPVCTRLCPPSYKHLLWTDVAVWDLQWRFVVVVSYMSPGRNAHILTETDIRCYSLCELVQIVCSSLKNTPINEVNTSFLIFLCFISPSFNSY